MIKKFQKWFHKCLNQGEAMKHGERSLSRACVKVPASGIAYELQLGGRSENTLHIYPAPPMTTSTGQPLPLMLVNPEYFFDGICGFILLQPEGSLVLGRHTQDQSTIFQYSSKVAARHISLSYFDNHLLIKDLDTDTGTYLKLLTNHEMVERVSLRRQEQINTLKKIFGGPLQPLPPDLALQQLHRAHTILLNQWPPNEASNFTSPVVIHLAAQTTPVLVGDLHGHLDNLLTLLTMGGYLDALATGKATLILLGDAVHPDEGKNLADMRNSMTMMDLIFSLIIRFPGQVVYLRGNHDGFEPEISKGGILQGVAWRTALQNTRGAAYVQAMENFYQDLPYIAVHPQVIACHAAPFMVPVNQQILTNLRQYPGLMRQLIWNRMYRPQKPGGYHTKDIRLFRQLLNVAPTTPLIVGHTPMDSQNTMWLNAGGIENHHILYGGNPQRMGWITFVNGVLTPLEYAVEPLGSLMQE